GAHGSASAATSAPLSAALLRARCTAGSGFWLRCPAACSGFGCARFSACRGISDARRLHRCDRLRRCGHSGRSPLKSLQWSCGVAGGLRRRLRALRCAVSVEEIIAQLFCFRKASTSARVGATEAPPNFVHLSAAVALAKRMISGNARPSASASVNPPWNASPPPSESITLTLKAGRCLTSPPSSQYTPSGPSVMARKPDRCPASLLRAAPYSLRPVVPNRASDDDTTWVPSASRGSVTSVA